MTATRERIGGYLVIAELARGGSSRVLLGRREDESDVRVLKQLRNELTHDSVARMRFQREALLAARLDHPNIARICWSGVEDGTFCVAMEYVAGQTLAAIAARLAERGQRMPEAIAIPIALGILDGLAYAHELTDGAGQPLSIVHRDLSADNVMVSYSGQPKIIDFGTARAQIDDFRTSPGVRVGTLLYMSPEQSMSRPLDHRSDLYTVAVLLFELLTGRPLVRASSTIDALEEIAYRVAPPANEIVPSISDGLAGAISRGLAKDPQHRWQSAREFAGALRAEAEVSATTPAQEVGRFVQELFPRSDREEEEATIPDEGESTLYLDTKVPPEESPAAGRRLPPEQPVPAPAPRITLWIAIALMIGFTLGVVTERAGWWRPPPPGGPSLHGSNPPPPP